MVEAVQLTAAHWVYAAFVILIFVTLALRRDTSRWRRAGWSRSNSTPILSAKCSSEKAGSTSGWRGRWVSAGWRS